MSRTTGSSVGVERDRRRLAILISLAVGFAMLGGKWAAYLLTGSHAILSDALESVVHVFATGIAFWSLVLSQRPPDPKYPYGYGKVGYFSAGFEGGLITLAAGAIVYQAIQGLIHPEPLRSLGWGVLIIAVAGVVNLALGLWLVRLGKRGGSLILEADGHHVLSDAYTSIGVLVGVLLVLATGWSWLDPVVAILVAMSIVKTGYSLVQEAALGLMDRADPGLLEGIVGVLEGARQPGWLDVHELRAWQAGDRRFVDFHLVVPESWTVLQLHEANDQCRAALKTALGEATEVMIHFDPERAERSWNLVEGPWTVESAVRSPAQEGREASAGAVVT